MAVIDFDANSLASGIYIFRIKSVAIDGTEASQLIK